MDRIRQDPPPLAAAHPQSCADAAHVGELSEATACRVVALEAAFRRIAEMRMRGLPIYNPALEVEATGFREHEDRLLGVLITPWFMNLVILPGPADSWEGIAPGTARELTFPAGPCTFLHTHEPAVGAYLACSLFSPMAAFPDQETARTAARAALAALLAPQGDEGTTGHGGKRCAEGETAAPVRAAAPGPRRREPLSRRGFLRAALGLEKQGEAGA